jgi:tetratricopeptide (TPR) repeat protein
MANEIGIALEYHQRGNLAEATRIYQSVLSRQPNHVDALHLLGVAALQQGQPKKAVEFISRAVALNPGAASFHCNLGEAYRVLGQLERAVSSCRTALQLQPNYPEAANNLGLALTGQGRIDEAISYYQQALQLRPEFPMAHNNLGSVLRGQGDTEKAAAHFRKALELDPNVAEAHSNLGQLLLEKGDPKGALRHCQEALRLRPNFPEAHSNLGNVLRELGKLEEAKGCYREALRLNPTLGMIYNNMGQAFQEEGRLDEAIAWYQQGLERDPNSARIHTNLASTLEELERHDEAITRYELALRLDPGYAEAHSGLGFVLHDQANYSAAEARFREAIRIKPDLAAAHCNLGTVLEELSRFEEAEKSFREALRHDPRHTGAYNQLATMLRAKLPDEDLEGLRRLLADDSIANDKRGALHFGLAQVLDARKMHAEAGEHLVQANALSLAGRRRRGQGYDPAEHGRFVEALIATFTPAFFEQKRGLGTDSERPIFIVGLPRSGTTLTEQILASHTQVFGAGELRFGRDDFEALAPGNPAESAAFEALARLDREAAGRLASRHLERLQELNATAARVADKMPDNYLFIGLLAILFPRAKFVHCRRDLRDTAVSCWMTNFRHIRWASDLDHIATRFQEYARLSGHWKEVLPVPVLDVEYEETVADLEGVARRLVDWCGLEWEPGCLAFHEGKRPVRTASVSQVRQPIYNTSVARWKKYEATLGPLFARLEQACG